jgi:catechol 2,3-dioxygenase-like lactoylglutathione lyase family enzyme
MTETTTSPSPTRPAPPLVAGLNHVAVTTADLDRLCTFYAELLDAEIVETPAPPGTRAATIRIGAGAGLAVLEAPGNPHVQGSTTMLDRGHLDHVAFDVPGPAELEEIRRRVLAQGAGDGTVSDYGPMLSVYFVDPDGMGTEACWLRDPTFTGAHAPERFTGSLGDL